ncbi:hypothetical protein [Algoriphagus sanaruensis]|nr:hypothetical protein [Algoriphagus sanaruensis]
MVAKFFGKLRLSDMQAFTSDIISEPDYSITYPLICDFRDCTAVGYRIDVPDFIRNHRSKVAIPQKKKYGLIISTLNQRFIFSLFKLSAPLLNLEVELFDHSEDCINWMTDNLDQKIELLSYLEKRG